MEQLLQQVERDINKYGNVRPATLKKLEKVMKEHQVLEGKGIVSSVKNYFHKALTSRPGVVDRLIKQYGDRRVMQVTILRKPVQGGVQKLLNLITLGGFNRAKNEMKYDEVYHLYVNMTLDNGQTIGIEKKSKRKCSGGRFSYSRFRSVKYVKNKL